MRKIAIIIILTLLLEQNAVSQVDSLKSCAKINRIIVADISKIPLNNVHIYNVRSGNGKVSDTFGRFNIFVKTQDSIILSRMGCKKIIIIINPYICSIINDTIIMYRDTMLLAETSVSPYKNWQAFKQEFIEVDLRGSKQEKIIISGVTQYEGPFIPQKPTLMNNPVSYIYKRYNKQGRINHKLLKIRDNRKSKFSN